MSSRYLVAFFVLFTSFSQVKSNHNHPVAKVKRGENVETLLKRYQLTPHNCNIATFLELNSLKANSLLIEGKLYKLPIIIIEYNGQSIRSSAGIEDYKLAKKIEKLNVDLLNSGIRDQHFTKNKRLWIPMVEFTCDTNQVLSPSNSTNYVSDSSESTVKTEVSPMTNVHTPGETVLKNTGVKMINVPLFGPKFENVYIEDFTLQGQVYYIISGHGGIDPGAVYQNGKIKLCEDEYAYDVALRLARNLMQHGAIVEIIVQDPNDGIREGLYLDCDTDELTLGQHLIPVSQKTRLQDRASKVNQLYNKYQKQGYKIHKAIEIHVDSRNQNHRQDVFFYYNNNSKKSKEMADNIRNVFQSKYDQHQKGRGYKGFIEDRGIYMVRAVTPPMVFVELANIRNESDQKRLLVNTNRQALANWLFEGIKQ